MARTPGISSKKRPASVRRGSKRLPIGNRQSWTIQADAIGSKRHYLMNSITLRMVDQPGKTAESESQNRRKLYGALRPARMLRLQFLLDLRCGLLRFICADAALAGT